MKNQTKSENRMDEYAELQANELNRLLRAAKTDDDLLATDRGVAFLASQLTSKAVVEVGKSTEAMAWARKATRRMWAEYERRAARREAERKAESEGTLVRFPRPRRS